MLTPKELMMSRYEAFKDEDWNYIANTSTCQNLTDLQNTPKIEWLKLEIIDFYDNFVEFKAYYRDNITKNIEILHEKSTFIKENGMWKYSEGKLFDSFIQRNDICPCGSGKKFKKCCR